MEYHSYYIVFPEGESQKIRHSLEIGDIVDINGIVYAKDYKLSPRQIAYQVTGLNKKIHFKEVDWYFKLTLLNADEVAGEILYRDIQDKKRKEKLDKVFDSLEKKIKKRRGF